MGKTYNLILNSGNSTQKTTNNDVSYLVDWGFLPQGKKFKVNFNFHSQHITDLTGSSVTQLMVYFDGTPTTYRTYNNVNGYSTSLCLGVLHPMQVSGTGGAKNMLQTDFLDNPSVYLQSKPNNNTLRVELQTLANATATYTFDAGAEYILIIHFEEDES